MASGIGRGVLPCFLADPHPELRRVTPGDLVLSRDLWLLIHREARGSARVAVVAEWLAERFAADARLFTGLGGEPASSKKRIAGLSPRASR